MQYIRIISFTMKSWKLQKLNKSRHHLLLFWWLMTVQLIDYITPTCSDNTMHTYTCNSKDCMCCIFFLLMSTLGSVIIRHLGAQLICRLWCIWVEAALRMRVIHSHTTLLHCIRGHLTHSGLHSHTGRNIFAVLVACSKLHEKYSACIFTLDNLISENGIKWKVWKQQKSIFFFFPPFPYN